MIYSQIHLETHKETPCRCWNLFEWNSWKEGASNGETSTDLRPFPQIFVAALASFRFVSSDQKLVWVLTDAPKTNYGGYSYGYINLVDMAERVDVTLLTNLGDDMTTSIPASLSLCIAYYKQFKVEKSLGSRLSSTKSSVTSCGTCIRTEFKTHCEEFTLSWLDWNNV